MLRFYLPHEKCDAERRENEDRLKLEAEGERPSDSAQPSLALYRSIHRDHAESDIYRIALRPLSAVHKNARYAKRDNKRRELQAAVLCNEHDRLHAVVREYHVKQAGQRLYADDRRNAEPRKDEQEIKVRHIVIAYGRDKRLAHGQRAELLHPVRQKSSIVP